MNYLKLNILLFCIAILSTCNTFENSAIVKNKKKVHDFKNIFTGNWFCITQDSIYFEIYIEKDLFITFYSLFDGHKIDQYKIIEDTLIFYDSVKYPSYNHYFEYGRYKMNYLDSTKLIYMNDSTCVYLEKIYDSIDLNDLLNFKDVEQLNDFHDSFLLRSKKYLQKKYFIHNPCF